MSRNAHAHSGETDFMQEAAGAEGHTFKQAAREWAGTAKDAVRDNMVRAGYHTETYVRSHPGRFIAGACCAGLAAGWFIARASQKRNAD